MAIVAEQIELRTNRDDTVLRLLNVEKFNDETGYRCDLVVRSGGFACERQFYFDGESFTDAIAALRRMIDGSSGEATIKFRYEDDFLRFEMNRLGHVFVSGELYEHSERSQSLKFAFRTDQTVLAPLVQEFVAVHDA
jgi:hypothetical protein